jgi:hypothetical protein
MNEAESGRTGREVPKSVDEFLAGIASRERSQGRLSVAALTAALCAAQLEAQCREVLQHRRHAPGPDDVGSLIADLQHARERLSALMHRAFAMETVSTDTLRSRDADVDAKLFKQLDYQALLGQFVTAGLEAASHIESLARAARRVRKLRREVRGGSPTEDALLGAASVAVLDVLRRALRMSRLRDPELRAASVCALARLRALRVEPVFGEADEATGPPRLGLDTARRN